MLDVVLCPPFDKVVCPICGSAVKQVHRGPLSVTVACTGLTCKIKEITFDFVDLEIGAIESPITESPDDDTSNMQPSR